MNEKPVILSSPNHGWQSGFFSLAFHAVILVFAAWLFSFSVPPIKHEPTSKAGEIVLARVNPNTSLIEYRAEDTNPVASPNAELPPELPDSFVPNEPSLAPKSTEGPGLPVDLDNLGANQLDRIESNKNFLHQELNEDDLKSIAREQKALASRLPLGPRVSTKLFGSGSIEGRSFIFLIDRSSSMGDKGLGVLTQAERELDNAISALTEENYFQILAYNNQATLIGQRSMLAGTKQNKLHVRQFMAGLSAFGSTNHEAGLYSALALRPDVIVWMTDGGYPELNEGEIDAFCSAAGKHVAIHAIQFGSIPEAPSRSFMKNIVEKTGGSYRYIDVHSWDLPQK